MAYLQAMDIPAPLRQLPNQLTVARIASVPVLCLLVALSTDWHVDFLRWLALLIYVASAVTDWLDGFLARRMKMQSDLGKMLDPIADKLLVGALIVTFAWTRDFSGFDLIPAIAILIREIFVSGPERIHGQARDLRPGHVPCQVEDDGPTRRTVRRNALGPLGRHVVCRGHSALARRRR